MKIQFDANQALIVHTSNRFLSSVEVPQETTCSQITQHLKIKPTRGLQHFSLQAVSFQQL